MLREEANEQGKNNMAQEPYDSGAISFQCQLNEKWYVIGYFVKELCDTGVCRIFATKIEMQIGMRSL